MSTTSDLDLILDALTRPDELLPVVDIAPDGTVRPVNPKGTHE